VSALTLIVDGHWTQASRMAAGGASFVTADQLVALDASDELSLDALDRLDFAAAELDDRGVILQWNTKAADLSGTAPVRAIGRNFFGDIAPCTANALFAGVFRRGVQDGGMDLVFFYTFSYKVSPIEAKVHLYRGDAGRNWVLAKTK
jgi:photoactive yellow protein